MSFIFGKLAPPPPLNKRFKLCFKSFFESIPVQKTVSEVQKRDIFLILHFILQANGGGGYSLLSLLAMLLTTALYKH